MLASAPPPPSVCNQSSCAAVGFPCFTPNCNDWNSSHVPGGDFTLTCGPVTSYGTCMEMNSTFAQGKCKFNWDFRVCDEISCLHGSFDECNKLCERMVQIGTRAEYRKQCTSACHCWCDEPQSQYCRDGRYRELHRQLTASD